MKYLAIVSILLLIGCASVERAPSVVTKVIYQTAQLSLPARPSLPTLGSSDLACLPKDVKIKLRDRDLARKNYAEELETIIKSTNK